MDTLFHLHASLCRAPMKRSLNKIAGFGGDYRRISLGFFNPGSLRHVLTQKLIWRKINL